MTTSKKPGGRGGRREGAGRPATYRRITLDQEAAQQLAELLARYQAQSPQAHWTAAKLLSYLVTDAYRLHGERNA